MVDKSQETTHFGFQTVAKEQKADMVAHVSIPWHQNTMS